MDRAIDTIKDFINEHNDNNLCMDWQDVLDCEDISDSDKGIRLAYEVGKYNAYIELLYELERMSGRLSFVADKED
jgi:hypothetical protein